MLELYLISSVVCIVSILAVGKILSGVVTVDDLLKTIIFGFVPVLNVLVLCILLKYLSSERGLDGVVRNFLSKKVF